VRRRISTAWTSGSTSPTTGSEGGPQPAVPSSAGCCTARSARRLRRVRRNLEPHYAALAFIIARVRSSDKALLYVRRRGRSAPTRFAYSQAAAFLEQRLDVLRRVPRPRETIEQRSTSAVICACRSTLADRSAMLDHLECAKACRAIDDRGRLVRALTYLGARHMDLETTPSPSRWSGRLSRLPGSLAIARSRSLRPSIWRLALLAAW